MSKKLTLEEVKKEFINRGYIPLFNEYFNCKQNLSAKTEEGYKIETTLDKLKNNKIPCVFGSKNPYTIENIKLWLRLNKKQIILLSDKYISAKDKLKAKCLIDKNEWDITWSDLSQGRGCPKCANNLKSEKMKLTLDEIKRRLYILNPNILILSKEYINSESDLLCKCIKDGHEWVTTWVSLSQKHGCPKCSGNIKYNINEIKEMVKKINPNIEVISDEYLNSHEKLKLKCLIDGNEFDMSWTDISQGRGCPKCGILKRTGENSAVWNHNKTSEERLIQRSAPENYNWRKQVFEKDDYTCRCCGDNKGGNLQAHHLNGYNWAISERFDINNGITLCENCHKEFHNIYGYGNNTKEQFEEFEQNWKEQIISVFKRKQSINEKQ